MAGFQNQFSCIWVLNILTNLSAFRTIMRKGTLIGMTLSHTGKLLIPFLEEEENRQFSDELFKRTIDSF